MLSFSGRKGHERMEALKEAANSALQVGNAAHDQYSFKQTLFHVGWPR